MTPRETRPNGQLVRQMLVSTAIMLVIGFSWAVLSEGEATATEGGPAAATATLTTPPPDVGLDAPIVVAAADPAAEATSATRAPVAPPAAQPKAKLGGKRIKDMTFMEWVERFSPIVILLLVIALVIGRLPKLDLGHSDAFRHRRVMNWLPLGLTYAFLYMGRYNLNVAKTTMGDMMSIGDFGIIFGVGTAVYAVSFVINGPLTDRIGGKKAILIGAAGAAVANLLMGVITASGAEGNVVAYFAPLYGLNMYFQSFGAVAIVKVNAPWFHVRERGVFGAIFGILISLGIYFAFDWSELVVTFLPVAWVFFVPAILLAAFFVLDVFMVRNTPGEAGFDDFDTADASSGDDGPRLPVAQVFKMMFTNKIIVTIAFIEFCSGYLRQAIMQIYRPYVKAIDNPDELIVWVYNNWGLALCAAGILGGTVAGIISDRVFDSRRGPVAALLYGFMLVGAVIAFALIGTPMLGFMVVLMSLAIIGVHGMLSGTASMDFGGKKNVGIAVGIIDGFVYLGTAVMSLVYGLILPGNEIDAATGMRADANPDNWAIWPLAMIPLALLGLVLASRIWNAKPRPKGASAH